MRKDGVLKILRDHEAELNTAGILHLRLFGSVARGDDMSSSDVDLLADFDPSKRLTLLNMAGLEIASLSFWERRSTSRLV